MRPVHVDPDEAVAAFTQLAEPGCDAGRRCVMVPVHWGTFKLADEPMDEPPLRVRAAWTRAALPDADLWLLEAGETRSRARHR
jgi:N-acyl-phosphatidylethanolamine-hydrolysing phospholipase D